MSFRRFGLGAGTVALDKAVVVAVQLAMVPVLANRWGLELYGLWAMISTVPLLLAMTDFGIIQSSWAHMTRFVAEGAPGKARSALHTAWLANIAICSLVALLAMAVLWLLPPGMLPTSAALSASDARITIALLVLYGLSTIIFRTVMAIFRASGRFPLAAIVNTITYGTENFALIGTVLAGGSPVEAALVLLGLRIVAFAGIMVMTLRLFPARAPGFRGASRAEWSDLWRPALSASLLSMGLMAFLHGSTIALGAAAGAAAVPAFVAVRTISRLGLQMTQIVGLPGAQEFGTAMGRGDRRLAGRYCGSIGLFSLILALGMAGGLLLLGRPVVRIWTQGAIVPDMGLVAFMALSSFGVILWNPLSNLLLAVNRQKAIASVSVAVSVIGIVLIAGTGDRLGATAAGLGFALVDLVTLAVTLAFIWRHWWRDPQFRAGSARALADLRSPIASFRELRARTR